MKILRKTVCKRENALDFLRCAGKRDGINHYRYWLVFSGWKYEIEATKEEADRLRTALEKKNYYAVYMMLIETWS